MITQNKLTLFYYLKKNERTQLTIKTNIEVA